MDIFITGAFGFVGTNLLKALNKPFNHRIIAIDKVKSANSHYDECYSQNELEKADWEKVVVIIHLAGNTD